MDMQKPNKLNFVSTARFQEISKQIKRSIELMTQSTFQFSEPTSVHSPSIQNSVASASFEFREPQQKVNDDKDTLQELAELLSLLNIGHSDPSICKLDDSIEELVANNVIVNDGNDNSQTGVDMSTDRVTNRHRTHLDVSTNEQASPPMVEHVNQPLPKACQSDQCGSQTESAISEGDNSNVVLNDGNDNIQTCVDGSTGIDTNTQITHLDLDTNEQNRPPLKHQDNQPLPFLIKHIQSITWPDQQKIPFVPVMQLFGQTFDAVMVYGTVTSLNVENGGLSQRFVIDDGSGSVSVVWRANKHIIELLKNLHNLDGELKSCRNSGLSVLSENWQPNSKECKEMLESFNQIIHIVKREVTTRTKLKLFSCAAVVGKPLRRPGQDVVTLHSILIEDDSGRDRALELYYKKNLIRLYEENTLK